MIADSIRQRFQRQELLIEQLASRVQIDIRPYCDREGFPFLGRKKSLESIAEKIETGRYPCWSKLDDLYGCSIIIPNLLAEKKVVDDISKLVVILDAKLRGSSEKDPQQFRFDSTRLYCNIRPAVLDDSTLPIYTQIFEIQIRSAFEYAWSIATHRLVYKGDSVDWRRIRLASQLKGMVEQMDSMILGFDALSMHIQSSPWASLDAQVRIEKFFKNHVERGNIPTEASPSDWTRFSANVYELIRNSERPRGTKPIDVLEKAFIQLNVSVESQSGEKFPRSVSLFQWCFGVLTKENIVGPKIYNYNSPVTPEVLALFEHLKAHADVFDLHK